MRVPHRLLIFLAACVWCAGGMILLFKGFRLLTDTADTGGNSIWSLAAFFTGVILGLTKSSYLFDRSCKRNIRRILALKDPRIWQFYRPMFFLLLGLMILAGVLLNKMAQNSFPMAIAMGTLDISLAVALLTSAFTFFKYKGLGI